MAVHLFGGRWCTSSSVYAFKQTVQDEVSDLVKQTISKCFDMDDLLTSVKSKTEASKVIHGCKAAVKNGGFNLTKYVTKDNKLLSTIDVNYRAEEVRDLTSDMNSRALGVKWDVNEDAFYYVMKQVCARDDVTRA